MKSVLKWVSCGNPERAASCQAVQDNQLTQDKAAAEPLGCQEEQGTGARDWEQKEVPRNCRTRGASGGDVINRV